MSFPVFLKTESASLALANNNILGRLPIATSWSRIKQQRSVHAWASSCHSLCHIPGKEVPYFRPGLWLCSQSPCTAYAAAAVILGKPCSHDLPLCLQKQVNLISRVLTTTVFKYQQEIQIQLIIIHFLPQEKKYP